MAKGNPNPIIHPNMNIKNEPKPGPISKYGKIRASLNHTKPVNELTNQVGGDSEIVKMMKDGEVHTEAKQLLKELMKNSPHSATHRYNLFVIWLRSMTGKDLKSVVEMENLFSFVKDRFAFEQLKKIENNEQLNRLDIEKVKVLAEILEKIHNIKYGKKQVNVNVGYDNIREYMGFDDNDNTGNK